MHMEQTRKRRWLMVLFFGLIASLFIGFIYVALTGPIDPRYQRRIENAASDFRQELKSRNPVDRINIILPVGERIQVDNNVVVYRGLNNGIALIDVYITDLDPRSAYRHSVPKSDIGKNIRLGGHAYQLKSIGSAKIKLKRFKQ